MRLDQLLELFSQGIPGGTGQGQQGSEPAMEKGSCHLCVPKITPSMANLVTWIFQEIA